MGPFARFAAAVFVINAIGVLGLCVLGATARYASDSWNCLEDGVHLEGVGTVRLDEVVAQDWKPRCTHSESKGDAIRLHLAPRGVVRVGEAGVWTVEPGHGPPFERNGILTPDNGSPPRAVDLRLTPMPIFALIEGSPWRP